jgi:RecB family endonuclease NucS
VGTEIKVWEIVDDQVKPVEENCLGSEHLESELENWIIERPDLLGDDLFVISKQKSVQGVGRLDLIAIQPDGQLVIVELKRDKAPRATVAQALDYAAWLDKVSPKSIYIVRSPKRSWTDSVRKCQRSAPKTIAFCLCRQL